MTSLFLDESTRRVLWQQVADTMETYFAKVDTAPVSPKLDPHALRDVLRKVRFDQSISPSQAVEFVTNELWQNQVHLHHPCYFGLFNPTPTAMGIAADTIVAAFNPQIAAWSHSPFAAEVEMHILRIFGERFGYQYAETDGTFCSGGAEANHTAILTALTAHFPEFIESGVRALKAQPVLYVSAHAHDSFIKAAALCGLGQSAVRRVPITEKLQLNTVKLEEMIAQDIAAGFAPFMVVATAGTTGTGTIDPIIEIDTIIKRRRLWFHVDAAWGGGAIFSEKLKPLLTGTGNADSITFDAHKWLSVPMGAGLYITKHKDILSKTFRVQAEYMPKDARGLDIVDPFVHSMQWSRRFIGLKVFMSLLVAGWDGYAEVIDHQTAIGEYLREQLRANEWKIVNDTPLPVICFIDGRPNADNSLNRIEALTKAVVDSGKAWISFTKVYNGQPALRACITSYKTEKKHVDMLIQLLNSLH